jgi:hypothetical protein
MPQIQEYDLQRAFVIWAIGIPKKGIVGALLPGIVAWHTPNGGKRDAFEAKRLKDMGVVSGVPDYWLLWGTLYGLEFKKPGAGRLSDAQIELHPRLIHAGAVIATVDNLADAKAQIQAWKLCR